MSSAGPVSRTSAATILVLVQIATVGVALRTSLAGAGASAASPTCCSRSPPCSRSGPSSSTTSPISSGSSSSAAGILYFVAPFAIVRHIGFRTVIDQGDDARRAVRLPAVRHGVRLRVPVPRCRPGPAFFADPGDGTSPIRCSSASSPSPRRATAISCPPSTPGQTIAVMEALIGQLFLVTAVAKFSPARVAAARGAAARCRPTKDSSGPSSRISAARAQCGREPGVGERRCRRPSGEALDEIKSSDRGEPSAADVDADIIGEHEVQRNLGEIVEAQRDLDRVFEPGADGIAVGGRPPWIPATGNENRVAARGLVGLEPGSPSPSATKMSRSWSHESQARGQRKRGGMWPNGNSPMLSQSDTYELGDRRHECCGVRCELGQDFAGWRLSVWSDATTGSSEFEGSKPRGDVVHRHAAARIVNVMIQNWSAVTMSATTSLTGHWVRRGSVLPLRFGERDERVAESAPMSQPRFDRVAQIRCDVDGDAFVMLTEGAECPRRGILRRWRAAIPR